MAMITLKEFAERNGKNRANALQKVARGSFPSAVKVGNQWFVDENEVWTDGRVKSGAYRGWRGKGENPDTPQAEPQKIEFSESIMKKE